jgi:hypothetical protein
MELLDKGKHCHEEFCHQLDFLPTQCKLCGHFYCSEHFKYESHKCVEAEKLNYKIPTCELCQKTIEFKRGKNLDECLAEHMSKCELGSATKKESKPKKCAYKDCRSNKVFKVACEDCSLFFCVHHRIPESHECKMKQKRIPSSCSKQIQNADSNKKSSFFTVSVY